LQHINKIYEGSKQSIDTHFKELINSKRDELGKVQPNVQDDRNAATSIAQVFAAITDEHSRTLKLLRQTLDRFMDQEVHSDL
jgi:hypothetical protein